MQASGRKVIAKSPTIRDSTLPAYFREDETSQLLPCETVALHTGQAQNQGKYHMGPRYG